MSTYSELPDLMAMMTGDNKHLASADAMIDVLWVLYDRILRLTPQTCADPARDRFLLSRGHGAMSFYAILAAKGFIPKQVLPSFGTLSSPLGHHPDRVLLPVSEISSGSLTLM